MTITQIGVDKNIVEMLKVIEEDGYLNAHFEALEIDVTTMEYYTDIFLGVLKVLSKKMKLSNLKMNQLSEAEIAMGVYIKTMVECGLKIEVLSECEELAERYVNTKSTKKSVVLLSIAWLVDWLGLTLKIPGYYEISNKFIRFYLENPRLQRSVFIKK